MKIFRKRFVLTIAFLTQALMTTLGQNTQGVVTYELGTSVAHADKIKKKTDAKTNVKQSYELSFRGAKSTWTLSSSKENKKYRDLEKKIIIEEAELLGDNYLIKDVLKPIDWVLTEESDVFANYRVKKATSTRVQRTMIQSPSGPTMSAETVEIVAWYTPDIPVSHGPGDYWGLPGLILKLDDGAMAYTSSSISVNPKEKVSISKPKKGKNVTSQEYLKLRWEKREILKSLGGG